MKEVGGCFGSDEGSGQLVSIYIDYAFALVSVVTSWHFTPLPMLWTLREKELFGMLASPLLLSKDAFNGGYCLRNILVMRVLILRPDFVDHGSH